LTGRRAAAGLPWSRRVKTTAALLCSFEFIDAERDIHGEYKPQIDRHGPARRGQAGEL
jgi:hypothetical protein